MNNDKVLNKIKKCLALAKSPNAHEAAAAMRQAQKLMAAHGLTETDISLSNVLESDVRAASVSAVKWDCRLAEMVADAFACKRYSAEEHVLSPSLRWVKKRKYVFVGINAAAEIASYAYDVLARQCTKARVEHIRKQPKACKPVTKTARGDAFAMAWVYAVSELLEKFADSDSNEALVVSYMEHKHPDLKTAAVKDRSKGRNISNNDWHAGAAAGRNARLQRGVNGEQQQRRLSA